MGLYKKFNGYSDFIAEENEADVIENFTVTFACTPYTYESGMSGILTAFAESEQKGILIEVGKQGIVTARIGLRECIVEISSLKEHMEFQKRNMITIAFWGTAGWCDLYVNGVLSNRKQFRRHSVMPILKGKYYIGKQTKEKCGFFHGELEFISFAKDYLNYEKIISKHVEKYRETGIINLYEQEKYKEDRYRPVFHMIPPGKWMNEPHAPLYYRGKYHIFYQANPHAPIWDNICWGHLISEDMVDWKDAGIALYPDRDEIDIDGCWSGSACLDSAGVPILFYTAGNHKELPNQSVAIAVPKEKEDVTLRYWDKQGIVLRQSVGEGFVGEFRDPFVWRRGDIYYILVGTGDSQNGGGNALLYTSRDLQHFECHGFLVDYDYERYQEVGHVWELPVLLPLKDEKGEYVCDIFLFCACQIEKENVETYYFLGKFDEEQKRFQKFHAMPKLMDLGNGTFTGPSGFVTPDGRSIVFTIAQGKRNPEDEYRSGWAHNGGMPIELSIRGGELELTPISEIKKYFSKCIASDKRKAEEVKMLQEHRIRILCKGNYLELILEWDEDGYVISYNRKNGEWKARSTKTGEVVSKYRNEDDKILLGDEAIELECYVDHSLIELYLNRKKGMTLRSYPFCENNRLHINADSNYEIFIWEYQKL